MMMENKRCGELMIENHWMDKLLKEVLMIDELSIVETDKVNHTVEMDMLKLVVKVECFENGVTRPKKYSELSHTEAIQADCDIKETNIILQGLPPEVYALVINHKVAKETFGKNSNLMQGS
ncbi:hypothetical protein Tco_0410218 [Tanacetum coccineum]